VRPEMRGEPQQGSRSPLDWTFAQWGTVRTPDRNPFSNSVRRSLLVISLDVNTVLVAMKGGDAACIVWPGQPGLIRATVNFAQVAKEAVCRPSSIFRSVRQTAIRRATRAGNSFIAEQAYRSLIYADLLSRKLPYLQQGVLRMPVGKGRHSLLAADDQGRAIAALTL
jgi:NAD(P)H dehydrogenase (quinone)